MYSCKQPTEPLSLARIVAFLLIWSPTDPTWGHGIIVLVGSIHAVRLECQSGEVRGDERSPIDPRTPQPCAGRRVLRCCLCLYLCLCLARNQVSALAGPCEAGSLVQLVVLASIVVEPWSVQLDRLARCMRPCAGGRWWSRPMTMSSTERSSIGGRTADPKLTATGSFRHQFTNNVDDRNARGLDVKDNFAVAS